MRVVYDDPTIIASSKGFLDAESFVVIQTFPHPDVYWYDRIIKQPAVLNHSKAHCYLPRSAPIMTMHVFILPPGASADVVDWG